MDNEIILTPEGSLIWPEDSAVDWRENLFHLGSGPEDPGAPLSHLFWRTVARHFFDHFRQTAAELWPAGEFEGQVESDRIFKLAKISEELLPELIASAPPLPGGEYLNQGLPAIWEALAAWLEAALTAKSPAEFMNLHAPLWQKVGRVYFHLAENKGDPDQPFAFLATYTIGLTSAGRPLHKPLGEALRHYSTARDKPALLRLLTPVDNAARKLSWVKELVESQRVYRAHSLSSQKAWRFLKDIPALKEAGLWPRIPDWWQKRPQAQVKIILDPDRRTKLNAESLLAFDRRVMIGDDELSESELRELLQSEGGLLLIKGRWVEVDKERLQMALEQWKSLKNQVRGGLLTFSEGMRLLAGLPGRLKDLSEPELLNFTAGDRLARLLSDLRETPAIKGKMPAPLVDLRGRLRPYQLKGADWLVFMASLGLGACLADDMGLGKTIQVLTLLSHIKATNPPSGPSLLVLPASLLGNWRAEAHKFAPQLILRFLHPAINQGRDLKKWLEDPLKEAAECDLAVTTYALLTRQAFLSEINWNLVIADEAQALKNPGARQTKALKALKSKTRLALTGTPVENRLSDLWSLFDFLNPGLLGSSGEFAKYAARLAKSQAPAAYAPLKRLVGPYIMRRLKTDRQVIADLPDKIENLNFCPLSRKQIILYEKVVANLAEALHASDGPARRGLILQSIMRLKQICNHPDQLTGGGSYAARDSGKFSRLTEICAELAERRERVLIFTQFKEIIEPLAETLSRVYDRPGLILHGGTKTSERQKLVDQFQKPDGPPFFLLSLKAGGIGLNLTAAARVIHFDRWWNPAVENQATDRAFRIGQKQKVMVHKFICAGTVEEKIHRIIEEKKQIAEQLISGTGQIDLTSLNDEALLDLVRMDLSRAQAAS